MKATRESYGDALVELGKKYDNIVVLDADLASATKTVGFKAEFPERFFDMGIAEQDMVGTAAGLAIGGKIPFASTFSVFATGRAYDQIRNSIAYPNLNVKIAGTHAGVTVGEDGATHQALEDIALMRSMPNMTIVSPADDVQAHFLIEEAIKHNGPVYIRLARPATDDVYGINSKFEFGKGVQHGSGNDATIIATGVTVSEAIKAKEELEKDNINVRVIDIHTIKPIDKDIIVKAAKETKLIFTVEDHSVIGGLGTAVSDVLCEECPSKVIKLGVRDEFGKSGNWKELMDFYGITSKHIVQAVLDAQNK